MTQINPVVRPNMVYFESFSILAYELHSLLHGRKLASLSGLSNEWWIMFERRMSACTGYILIPDEGPLLETSNVISRRGSESILDTFAI